MTAPRLAKHLFIAVVTLLSCAPANAQFFSKVDEWFRKRQSNQVYDTTYIYRPQERWLVRTQSLNTWENVSLHARGQDRKNIDLSARSGLVFKQTIGAGYRGLVLDLGYVPGKMKRSADLEIKSNGNRFGFALGASFAYGFSGSSDVDGVAFALNRGDVIVVSTHASAYFAFNGKRFSMPAATSQNYRQLRSAGSPLLTFKAQVYGVFSNPETYPDAEIIGAGTAYLGLGGGYGYNWVPGENWLIHLSLTETVGFLNDSRIVFRENNERFSWESPIFVTGGNIAVLYYIKKWYFGIHATAEDLLFWSRRELNFSINRSLAKANVTLGVRF